MQLFLVITVPPAGFLALGVVVSARSPWLAAVGVVAGWVCSTVPWRIILDQATLYAAAARFSDVASLVRIEDAYRQSPYLAAGAVGWGLHLVGYLLLGVAFLRSELMPRWTDICLIAGTVLMVAARLWNRDQRAPGQRIRSRRRRECARSDATSGWRGATSGSPD